MSVIVLRLNIRDFVESQSLIEPTPPLYRLAVLIQREADLSEKWIKSQDRHFNSYLPVNI